MHDCTLHDVMCRTVKNGQCVCVVIEGGKDGKSVRKRKVT